MRIVLASAASALGGYLAGWAVTLQSVGVWREDGRARTAVVAHDESSVAQVLAAHREIGAALDHGTLAGVPARARVIGDAFFGINERVSDLALELSLAPDVPQARAIFERLTSALRTPSAH